MSTNKGPEQIYAKLKSQKETKPAIQKNNVSVTQKSIDKEMRIMATSALSLQGEGVNPDNLNLQ